MEEYNQIPDLLHQYRVRTTAQLFKILLKNQVTPEEKIREEKRNQLMEKTMNDYGKEVGKTRFLEKLINLLTEKGHTNILETDFTEEELRNDYNYRKLNELQIKLIPAAEIELETNIK